MNRNILQFIVVILFIFKLIESQNYDPKLEVTYRTLTTINYQIECLYEGKINQVCSITDQTTQSQLECQNDCKFGGGEIIGLEPGITYEINISDEYGENYQANFTTASTCTPNLQSNAVGQIRYACDYSNGLTPSKCFICTQEMNSDTLSCLNPDVLEPISECKYGVIDGLNLGITFNFIIFDRLQNIVSNDQIFVDNILLSQQGSYINVIRYASNINEENRGICSFFNSDREIQYSCINGTCACNGDTIIGLRQNFNEIIILNYLRYSIEFGVQTASNCEISYKSYLSDLTYRCIYPENTVPPNFCKACAVKNENICSNSGSYSSELCHEGVITGLSLNLLYSLTISDFYDSVVSETLASTLFRSLNNIEISLTSVTYEIRPMIIFEEGETCQLIETNTGRELTCEGGYCSCDTGKLIQMEPGFLYDVKVLYNDHIAVIDTVITASEGVLSVIANPFGASYTVSKLGIVPTTCAVCIRLGTNINTALEECKEQILSFSSDYCSNGVVEDLRPNLDYSLIILDSEKNSFASLVIRTINFDFMQVSQGVTSVSYVSNAGNETEYCSLFELSKELRCINENCLCRGDTITELNTFSFINIRFVYKDNEFNRRIQTASRCETQIFEFINTIFYMCLYPNERNIPSLCKSCITRQSDFSESCISDGSYELLNCVNGTFTNLDRDTRYQLVVYDQQNEEVSSITSSTIDRDIRPVTISLTSISYSIAPQLELLQEFSCEFIDTSTGMSVSCQEGDCSCNSGILINLSPNVEYNLQSSYDGKLLAIGNLKTANFCILSLESSLFGISYNCQYTSNTLSPSYCKVCIYESSEEQTDPFECLLNNNDIPLSETACYTGNQDDLMPSTQYKVYLLDKDNMVVSEGLVFTKEFLFDQKTRNIHTITYETNIPQNGEMSCSFIDSSTKQTLLCDENNICSCNAGRIINLEENTTLNISISYSTYVFSATLKTASKCSLLAYPGIIATGYQCSFPQNTFTPSMCAYCLAQGLDTELNNQQCLNNLSFFDPEFCYSANSIPTEVNMTYTLRLFDMDIFEVAKSTFNRVLSTIVQIEQLYRSLSYEVVPFNKEYINSTCQIRLSNSQTKLSCEDDVCSCFSGKLVGLEHTTYYNIEIYFNDILIARGTLQTASKGTISELSNGLNSLMYSMSYNQGISPSFCYVCVFDETTKIKKCFLNDETITKDKNATIIVSPEFDPEIACWTGVLTNLTDTNPYTATIYDYDEISLTEFNFSTVELNPSFNVEFTEEFVSYKINFKDENNRPFKCIFYVNINSILTKLNCRSGECDCFSDFIIDFPIDQPEAVIEMYDDFQELIVTLNKGRPAPLSPGAIAGIVVALLVVLPIIITVSIVLYVKLR